MRTESWQGLLCLGYPQADRGGRCATLPIYRAHLCFRGRENKDVPGKSEEWHIARLDPLEDNPNTEDLAKIPFASRPLTFDGKHFWSNHRAANETISFSLPAK